MKFDLLKYSRWTATWVATWTMVASPVAMGAETEAYPKSVLQQAINESGLNRSITLGEFYEINKKNFPPFVQQQMDPFVKQFKNQKMPQFELVTTKATDGSEVPTIRISQDGKLYNTQWYGERYKEITFNGVPLTYADMHNFNDMFVRLTSSDEKIRKQFPQLAEAKAPPAKKFDHAKYPDVTAKEWKQMSQFDRAAYIVNFRLLWMDAEKVLAEKRAKESKGGKAPKKTSQNIFEKNEFFFELFFGQDANAQTRRARAGAPAAATGSQGAAYDGKSCIVAGYVAKYDKGQFCSHQLIHEQYNIRDNSLYQMAAEHCQRSSQIPCNPYVFGAPGGTPTCITVSRTSEEFQTATHYNGKCDTASRLASSETQVIKDAKDNGRYSGDNLLSEEERKKKVYESNQGRDALEATESYLLGVLKFRGAVKADAASLFQDELLDEKVLEQILIDKRYFDEQIKNANASCKAESDAGAVKHEKNYWKACDNLHRRFLFVEELFASKCVGSDLDRTTLKCACKAPSTEKIMPGTQCSRPAAVTPPVSADATRPPITPSADRTPPAVDCKRYGMLAPQLDTQCKCPGGSDPKLKLTNGSNDVFTCGPVEDKVKAEACTGFLCGIPSWLKMVGGIALAAVGAWGIWKLTQKMYPKPKLTNPGDGCTTNAAIPCRPVCTEPYSMQAGGCGCAPCVGGQTYVALCKCGTPGTDPTTPEVLLRCPDGVSMRANTTACPYYACNTTNPPTSYQNPSNCPAAGTSSVTTPTPPTGGKTR